MCEFGLKLILTWVKLNRPWMAREDKEKKSKILKKSDCRNCRI